MPRQEYTDSFGNKYWDESTRAIHVSPQEMAVYEERWAADRAAEREAQAKEEAAQAEAWRNFLQLSQDLREAGYSDYCINANFAPDVPEKVKRNVERDAARSSRSSISCAEIAAVIIGIVFVASFLVAMTGGGK